MSRIAGLTDVDIGDDVTVPGLFIASGTVSMNASVIGIGNTLSGRIGFYGATPTSQPADATQATMTMAAGYHSVSAVIGFSTTAPLASLLAWAGAVTLCLKEAGLWKGGA